MLLQKTSIWYKVFKSGREVVKDLFRSGRTLWPMEESLPQTTIPPALCRARPCACLWCQAMLIGWEWVFANAAAGVYLLQALICIITSSSMCSSFVPLQTPPNQQK